MKLYINQFASLLWSTVNHVARRFYANKQVTLPVPSIVVGNIQAGGVGKTEVVAYLANHLLKVQKKVVVAMRGYGAPEFETTTAIFTSYEQAARAHAPDEAQVLLKKCPGLSVVVGKHRVDALYEHCFASGKQLPDCVIFDDGLQQFKIKSDLKILVHHFGVKTVKRDFSKVQHTCDIKLGFGVKELIPSDYLSSEYRLQGIVPTPMNKQDDPFYASKYFAFCGIGNPQRFFQFLSDNHVAFDRGQVFADHYRYQKSDVQHLLKISRERPLLTTLKDYVKLVPHRIPHLHYVDVALEVSNPDTLLAALNRVVGIG